MSRISHYLRLSVMAIAVSSALAACGGGGSGSTVAPETNKDAGAPAPSPASAPSPSPSPAPAPTPAPANPLPAPVAAGASTSMACADGSDTVCSGSTVLRTDNGVTLLGSGVAVTGRSATDLAASGSTTAIPTGLAPLAGGVSEMRVKKDANGAVTGAALLLDKLGLSWDGAKERPQIIETFATNAGRISLNASGALQNAALPASSDTTFFDFASKGAAATQADYANNVYFPRAAATRCGTGVTDCPATETSGLHYQAGDWREGQVHPDLTVAERLHEDGDLRAGDGVDSSGASVPFAGTEGYRALIAANFQYAYLGRWLSQDNVNIAGWSNQGERATVRRGAIAFGDVTKVADIPATGTASYAGIAYGWYSANGKDDPLTFRADVIMNVDFLTRQVTVSLANAVTDDADAKPVPVTLTSTSWMGAAGSNVANYLTGAAAAGKMSGGLGARYFGPVSTAGTGVGPAETGGSFSLTDAATGEVVMGGFIARKK